MVDRQKISDTFLEMSMKRQSDFIRTQSEENGLWRFIRRDSDLNKQMILLEEALAKFGLSQNEVRIYIYLERTADVFSNFGAYRKETIIEFNLRGGETFGAEFLVAAKKKRLRIGGIKCDPPPRRKRRKGYMYFWQYGN